MCRIALDRESRKAEISETKYLEKSGPNQLGAVSTWWNRLDAISIWCNRLGAYRVGAI